MHIHTQVLIQHIFTLYQGKNYFKYKNCVFYFVVFFYSVIPSLYTAYAELLSRVSGCVIREGV